MDKNLNYPVVFTALGFLINSFIDEGGYISVEDMRKHIDNETVWALLEEKLENGWLSLFSDTQRKELLDYFQSSVNAIDEERKYGVEKNGYCLLIAYLFEAVQSGVDSGWFPSLKQKKRV